MSTAPRHEEHIRREIDEAVAALGAAVDVAIERGEATRAAHLQQMRCELSIDADHRDAVSHVREMVDFVDSQLGAALDPRVADAQRRHGLGHLVGWSIAGRVPREEITRRLEAAEARSAGGHLALELYGLRAALEQAPPRRRWTDDIDVDFEQRADALREAARGGADNSAADNSAADNSASEALDDAFATWVGQNARERRVVALVADDERVPRRVRCLAHLHLIAHGLATNVPRAEARAHRLVEVAGDDALDVACALGSLALQAGEPGLLDPIERLVGDGAASASVWRLRAVASLARFDVNDAQRCLNASRAAARRVLPPRLDDALPGRPDPWNRLAVLRADPNCMAARAVLDAGEAELRAGCDLGAAVERATAIVDRAQDPALRLRGRLFVWRLAYCRGRTAEMCEALGSLARAILGDRGALFDVGGAVRALVDATVETAAHLDDRQPETGHALAACHAVLRHTRHGDWRVALDAVVALSRPYGDSHGLREAFDAMRRASRLVDPPGIDLDALRYYVLRSMPSVVAPPPSVVDALLAPSAGRALRIASHVDLAVRGLEMGLFAAVSDHADAIEAIDPAGAEATRVRLLARRARGDIDGALAAAQLVLSRLGSVSGRARIAAIAARCALELGRSELARTWAARTLGFAAEESDWYGVRADLVALMADLRRIGTL